MINIITCMNVEQIDVLGQFEFSFCKTFVSLNAIIQYAVQ